MTNQQQAARSVGIAAAFRQSARRFAGRVAVESEDGVSLTYRELDRLAASVAALMLRRGVRRGDRVAGMADPCPGYVAVNLACAKLGATLVGINTRYTTADADYCVRDSEAKLLFFDDAHRDVLDGVTGAAEGVELSLASLGEALAGVDQTALVETGRPKGAMISQAAAARYGRCGWCRGSG